jgi:hypothetical protein
VLFGPAVLLAALVAGCGGSSKPPATTAAQPRIPAAIGSALAARADRVAADLANGEDCAAAAEARRLNTALERAVASGAVPAQLQAPALTAAVRLSSRIVCHQRTSPTRTATSPTTASTTTASSCDQLQTQKQALEQQKRTLEEAKKAVGKTLKGPAADARNRAIDAARQAIDQAEHALDQQAHAAGCH